MRKCLLFQVLVFSLLLSSCGKKVVVDTIDIIPEPVFLVQKEGSYVITKKTKVCFENIGQNNETARQIVRMFRKSHLRLAFSPNSTSDCIIFHLNDTTNDLIGEEGYLLEVRPDHISISANTEVGLFYGFQTLVQMLPADASHVHYSRIQLPLCTIQDYPAYSWRGSLVDVSRHMISVKDIKRHLDLMALYKLNKFHWHLADDHGWRIEIDKYPQLNDIGSWRADRSDEVWDSIAPAKENESANYGGFYTKEEIEEVVQYAARLHIDVIPEIGLPSHCSAVLASYPEWACSGDTTQYQVQVGPYWPSEASLCLGNDSVLQFCRDIMDEIIRLFPYEYIHVGGANPYTEHWSHCPKCQLRMRQCGLDSADQLNSWFAREMEKYLELQGRKVIGWEEVGSGLSGHSLVMWRDVLSDSLQSLVKGHNFIAMPISYCYFDYVQGNPTFQPAGPKGYLTLSKVYQFDPLPQGVSPELRSHILGGQCVLWTEYINHYDDAQYMLLPRMLAFSENLWSPRERRDWTRFRHKVEVHKQLLSQMGYRYCEGSFMPLVSATDNHDDTYTVAIDYEVEGMRIYYCIGEEPKEGSRILYTTPITVPSGSVVKAVAYYKGKFMEEVYTFSIGPQNVE